MMSKVIKMETVRSLNQIRKKSLEFKENLQTVAFVPTMGSLHKGHLSLIDYAKINADIVIVSIFVNPMQFNENKDFNNYPRNENDDITLCRSKSVDIVFIPTEEEIINNLSVKVYENELSNFYCGKFRPGHFEGVCTIVLKLFNLIQPNIAIFGQKDFQQLKIIEKMVNDLNILIKIHSVPTLRENDGLAMSSRNKLLSISERQLATNIYKLLLEGKKIFDDGENNVKKILTTISFSNNSIDNFALEYIDIVDYKTFKKINKIIHKSVLIIAVRIGKIRLIDNIILND